MEQMKKMPLEGIRVVELATVVAAPTASRVLCAFGAEVIKVETKIDRRAARVAVLPRAAGPRPHPRAVHLLNMQKTPRRDRRGVSIFK